MIDTDLLELIDDISRVTFEIRKLYDDLTIIMQNDNHNNMERINNIIKALLYLKIEEADLYSYIENAPFDLVRIMNYLSENEKANVKYMDDVAKLCYKRIINNLRIILMLSDSSFLMLGKDFFKTDQKFNYLINNGVSYEDAVDFYRHFYFNYEKSIAYRFTTTLNESLKNTKTKNEKNKLIAIKLNTAFVKGNELEDELIMSNFTTVKNNYKEEISFDYGIDTILKEDFKEMWALTNLHINIERLSKLAPGDLAIQLIFDFKTFILYVNDIDLSIFKQNLSKKAFTSSTIKKILLSAIDNIKNDIKIHNQDNNSKSL